ncbi:MAG: hypothetical protein JXR50_12445 [Prolixibacteraceae bacterium]|nr:hypothetical protein [Prolixibacteraceae bacterium]MBN2650543.1 hypothetical protein [Prolixibacteraceae bacterium]
MKQLHNEQVLDQVVTQHPDIQNDLMTATFESQNEKESEIEKGNLSDYLEIFGEVDDI